MAISLHPFTKLELLSDFFTKATHIELIGNYVDSTGANPTIQDSAENRIELNMQFNNDAFGPTDIVAYLNELTALTEYFIIRLDDKVYDTFNAKFLHFVSATGLPIYFSYQFPEDIVFTGNGELYIEKIDFTMS